MVLVKIIKLIIDINRGRHFTLNLQNLQKFVLQKFLPKLHMIQTRRNEFLKEKGRTLFSNKLVMSNCTDCQFLIASFVCRIIFNVCHCVIFAIGWKTFFIISEWNFHHLYQKIYFNTHSIWVPKFNLIPCNIHGNNLLHSQMQTVKQDQPEWRWVLWP